MFGLFGFGLFGWWWCGEVFDCCDEALDCALVVPAPAVVVVWFYVVGVWFGPNVFEFCELLCECCGVDVLCVGWLVGWCECFVGGWFFGVCVHGALRPFSVNALWVMGICCAKWYSMRCANAWISSWAVSCVRSEMKFMRDRALTVQ